MSEILLNDSYLYVIIALLPLSASMVIVQANPYHALIIRGILGAVAALVYAVLGAADVALTEALVGTMLAITLYAVAVRSSLVMRLGVLEAEPKTGLIESNGDDRQDSNAEPQFKQLMEELRILLGKRHMRLELVTYTTMQALHQALMEKEVHAICARSERLKDLEYLEDLAQDCAADGNEKRSYQTTTRIQRIYDILQTELSSPATNLTYVHTPDLSSPVDLGRKEANV